MHPRALRRRGWWAAAEAAPQRPGGGSGDGGGGGGGSGGGRGRGRGRPSCRGEADARARGQSCGGGCEGGGPRAVVSCYSCRGGRGATAAVCPRGVGACGGATASGGGHGGRVERTPRQRQVQRELLGGRQRRGARRRRRRKEPGTRPVGVDVFPPARLRIGDLARTRYGAGSRRDVLSDLPPVVGTLRPRDVGSALRPGPRRGVAAVCRAQAAVPAGAAPRERSDRRGHAQSERGRGAAQASGDPNGFLLYAGCGTAEVGASCGCYGAGCGC